jgi:hypothetical protein
VVEKYDNKRTITNTAPFVLFQYEEKKNTHRERERERRAITTGNPNIK